VKSRAEREGGANIGAGWQVFATSPGAAGVEVLVNPVHFGPVPSSMAIASAAALGAVW